jgi:hypothetical protein
VLSPGQVIQPPVSNVVNGMFAGMPPVPDESGS